MKNILLATALLVAATGFAGAPKKLTPAKDTAAKDAAAHEDCDDSKDDAAKSGAATPAGEVVLRGEKLKGSPSVTLADLLKKPSDYAGKTVTVDATVRRACERKGCWMELAGAQADKGPGVRVTFKDYGFFVPLDSAGRKAKVEGVVKVAQLSEETAKHYESEGASVPRGADGKPTEVQLEATGVELRK